MLVGRTQALLAPLLVGLLLLGTPPAHAEAAASPVSPAVAASTLRVVGLGDSVMRGTHCRCSGIVARYSAALSARLRRPVVGTNVGEDGLRTGGLLADLDHHAGLRGAVASADVVLLTVGANDLSPQLRAWRRGSCRPRCYRPAAVAMGRRLARALAVIRGLRPQHAAASVLVTDYWNVYTDGAVARRQGGRAQLLWSEHVTSVANRRICRAAVDEGARCVDLVRPFTGVVYGHGRRDPTALLAADGDHPNATGVRRIVSTLVDATPPL